MSPGANLEAGAPISDEDEVTRFCGPGKIPSGDLQAVAFTRRPNECKPSYNWIQFFIGLSRADAVECIRKELRSHLDTKNGRIIVLNVGEVRRAAFSVGCAVGIIYDPKPAQPSHSLMAGLPPNGSSAEALKIAIAILRLVCPRRDIYTA